MRVLIPWSTVLLLAACGTMDPYGPGPGVGGGSDLPTLDSADPGTGNSTATGTATTGTGGTTANATMLSAPHSEDFENGIPPLWVVSGDGSWTTGSEWSYTGSMAAHNDPLGDDQIAALSVDITLSEDGYLEFYTSGSTESEYDFLKFRVGKDAPTEWSGTWTDEVHRELLGPGTYNLSWVYSKDANFAAGLDTASIDSFSLVLGLP